MSKVLLGLIVTLILGDYIYTWSAGSENEREKQSWRQDHNRILAEQFKQINEERRQINEKIEKGQEKIQKDIEQQNQKLNDILIEFLKRDMAKERGGASERGR